MTEKLSLDKDLYPYQVEDYQKLSNIDNSYLILSEMGTGKTPIALALSRDYWTGPKTLVVCPKTLQLEWSKQIETWCGITPSIARRSSYRRLEPLFDDSNPFFITNYETFRKKEHLDILTTYPFQLVILDEGHVVRKSTAKMTRGLLEFFKERRLHSDLRAIVMTGSPIVNNPADLHTLLCIVDPDNYRLGTRMDFINQYCIYVRRRHGYKVVGARNLDQLKEKTEKYTIRRTRKEVLPFLPEKFYRKVSLLMEEEQRKVYDQMENDLMILLDDGTPLYSPSVLAELIRLRQINLDPGLLGVNCSSSKTTFLLDLLEGFGITRNGKGTGEGEKLVVFSCFKSYINRLSKQLDELEVKHVKITGEVNTTDRAKAIETFQTDSTVPVILGTIQSMGVGITLTAASNLVMMDRWWTPALNEQAIDRIYRIGQENAVQIIIPVNEKSVDSSLDRILSAKQKMMSAYLNEDVQSEVLNDLISSKKTINLGSVIESMEKEEVY